MRGPFFTGLPFADEVIFEKRAVGIENEISNFWGWMASQPRVRIIHPEPTGGAVHRTTVFSSESEVHAVPPSAGHGCLRLDTDCGVG